MLTLLTFLGLAVNFLLIESLQRFHQYYGDDLQVECPTGSGDYMNLANVAEEIQHRIIHIFGRDMDGRRALNGGNQKLDYDPHFRDYVLFYEVRCSVDFLDCSNRGLILISWFSCAVLSRRRREGIGRVAPDWVVRLGRASYPTEWSELSVAQDAEEYVSFYPFASFLRHLSDLKSLARHLAPRSMAHHYFDETIDSQSEYDPDDAQSLLSAYSTADMNTLGDLSPDAL